MKLHVLNNQLSQVIANERTNWDWIWSKPTPILEGVFTRYLNAYDNVKKQDEQALNAISEKWDASKTYRKSIEYAQETLKAKIAALEHTAPTLYADLMTYYLNHIFNHSAGDVDLDLAAQKLEETCKAASAPEIEAANAFITDAHEILQNDALQGELITRDAILAQLKAAIENMADKDRREAFTTKIDNFPDEQDVEELFAETILKNNGFQLDVTSDHVADILDILEKKSDNGENILDAKYEKAIKPILRDALPDGEFEALVKQREIQAAQQGLEAAQQRLSSLTVVEKKTDPESHEDLQQHPEPEPQAPGQQLTEQLPKRLETIHETSESDNPPLVPPNSPVMSPQDNDQPQHSRNESQTISGTTTSPYTSPTKQLFSYNKKHHGPKHSDRRDNQNKQHAGQGAPVPPIQFVAESNSLKTQKRNGKKTRGC